MTNVLLQQYFATLATSNSIVCSTDTMLVSDNAKIAHSNVTSARRPKQPFKPNRWDSSGCRSLLNSKQDQVLPTRSRNFGICGERLIIQSGTPPKLSRRRSNSHPPRCAGETMSKDRPVQHPLRAPLHEGKEKRRRSSWSSDNREQILHAIRCLPSLTPVTPYRPPTPRPRSRTHAQEMVYQNAITANGRTRNIYQMSMSGRIQNVSQRQTSVTLMA